MYNVVFTDANNLSGADYSIELEIFKENGVAFHIKNCRSDNDIIQKCADA